MVQDNKNFGQAIYDILTKDQPVFTVEDILEGSKYRFVEEFEKCVNLNKDKFNKPFYVLVLTAKEMWSANNVRNWFIARNRAPYALDLVCWYPNHTKTLYLVDAKNGRLKILWSIPGIEEVKSILKHQDLYDPQLVKWIVECFASKYEKDKYTFEEAI